MLELYRISSGYGQARVLHNLSLQVRPGEILCLMGRNGAGKTTTMKTIMGLLPLMTGEIRLGDTAISSLPAHRIATCGIGYIPQGRRLFSELTVAENLEVGLLTRGTTRNTRDDVLDLFPKLRERLDQRAQTLSGGEQQMLATARALCLEPEYLLLDEPTEGLQPSMIDTIRDVVTLMRDRGVGILLVEQHIDAALSLADRVALIENGRNVDTFDVEILRNDPSALARHLGV